MISFIHVQNKDSNCLATQLFSMQLETVKRSLLVLRHIIFTESRFPGMKEKIRENQHC